MRIRRQKCFSLNPFTAFGAFGKNGNFMKGVRAMGKDGAGAWQATKEMGKGVGKVAGTALGAPIMGALAVPTIGITAANSEFGINDV